MASSTPPSMGTTAVVEPRETGWQAIEPTSTQAIVLKETDPVIRGGNLVRSCGGCFRFHCLTIGHSKVPQQCICFNCTKTTDKSWTN